MAGKIGIIVGVGASLLVAFGAVAAVYRMAVDSKDKDTVVPACLSEKNPRLRCGETIRDPLWIAPRPPV